MIMPIILMLLALACVSADDSQLTLAGFTITLLGAISASVKTVASNELVRPYNTAPVVFFHDLLLKVSAAASIQALAYAFAVGECNKLSDHINTAQGGIFDNLKLSWSVLALDLLLAFAVNFWSFKMNSNVGPLAITTTGSLKQCLSLSVSALLVPGDFRSTTFLGLALLAVGLIWSCTVS